MTDHDLPPAPSRRALWDQRHAVGEPIESSEPDPTLVDEIGSLRPGRALDLGAGDGRNAIWLARHGWQVTAVDFSQVALDRGRGLATVSGVRVEWQLADLLDWSPGARLYDLVALFFIHLPREERRDVYARAAAAVAPGGTLLVVGHDRTNLADGVGGPQDPDVLFTPGEVAADLVGFRIERTEVVRRRAADGRGPIDAIVRAVRVAEDRPGGRRMTSRDD
jgi:SAM-dependent methyltransferase